MSCTILVDGDIIAYQAAAACEQPVKWDDDLWTLHSSESEACMAAEELIIGLQEKLNAGRVVIALSDADNWRKDIMPDYKAKRKNIRKPLTLRPVREHLTAAFETFQRPKLEGDDILGILATSRVIKGDKIIVSIDKDLKTIPGLHYNQRNDDLGVFEVAEPEADYWHLFQTLTGDASDDYSGCPGVGPKKAASILPSLDEFKRLGVPVVWRECVVPAYKKANLSEEYALIMARVARILRASDYDFKKKQPILWSPKG